MATGFAERLRTWLVSLYRWAAHDGLYLIPLAAALACLPRVLRGVSCGHDFDFHLDSWIEVQQAWSHGLWYPHWAQAANWGAGEPRFVFYPPLSWLTGALLHFVTPWRRAVTIYTGLCLAITGLTTRKLAAECLPGAQATLAGVLATVTPYALFTAYERTAYSELAAAALLPLLLLFALRQGRRGDAGWLALVLAAIWLTNAPVGVMASYLLAFAALIAALVRRSWRPVMRASIAAPLGLGLAAFYLVPAAWEQRWIAIRHALDVGMRIQDSWLFARHASADLEFHDQVLRVASTIVAGTVALAALGLVGAWWRGRLTATRAIWLPLAMAIPVVLVLQFPVSALIWHLPKMEFLQFPWRWLAVLDIPLAVFLAAATPLASLRARVLAAVGWGAVLVVMAGVASSVFYQNCDQEDLIDSQTAAIRNNTGVAGTDEYAPTGADNDLVASNLPQACLVSDPQVELGESGDSDDVPVWYAEQGSCDGTFNAQIWESEHKLIQVDSDHAGFLVLRLRRYPAWSMTVNGHAAVLAAQRADGLVVVAIPPGPSTIEVRWSVTADVRWGRWISFAAVAGWLLIWLAEGRTRLSW